VAPPVTSAKAILLAAALQGAALPLPAQGGDLRRLFPAAPAGYVTDVTGTLDRAAVERLDSLAQRLRAATGAELAVAVLPTIGDRAAVDVAVAIGRAWGVGDSAAIGDPRRNAGVVLLLVPKRPDDPNSGQVFIATGQGLEGIVTDLQAGRVRDVMTPYFKRGEYGAGLEAGVGALAALIARGMGVTDSALTAGDRALPPSPGEQGGLPQVVVAVLLGGLFLVIFALSGIFRAAGGPRRRGPGGPWFWGGGFGGGFGGGGFGGFGGFGGGGGGGGFGGFGGGGGFSGGGAGGRF
jgi:uncharacterized protein